VAKSYTEDHHNLPIRLYSNLRSPPDETTDPIAGQTRCSGLKRGDLMRLQLIRCATHCGRTPSVLRLRCRQERQGTAFHERSIEAALSREHIARKPMTCILLPWKSSAQRSRRGVPTAQIPLWKERLTREDEDPPESPLNAVNGDWAKNGASDLLLSDVRHPTQYVNPCDIEVFWGIPPQA
jgi:hypothetical protein